MTDPERQLRAALRELAEAIDEHRIPPRAPWCRWCARIEAALIRAKQLLGEAKP